VDGAFHLVPVLPAEPIKGDWDMVLIERLAEIEHKQWIQWAKTLLEKEPGISKERRERWEKLFVPYHELSEEWKEYDREWARHSLRECKLQLDEECSGIF
jgi:hypothetical protein